MTAHKHAALMLQYAQDAAETNTPWERWQFRIRGETTWCDFDGHFRPTWGDGTEYRRNPHTMTYTVTIPEPLRKAPKRGESYYVVDMNAIPLYHLYWWYDDEADRRNLKRGLCFATKEDAIAAAKAMMPVEGEQA